MSYFRVLAIAGFALACQATTADRRELAFDAEAVGALEVTVDRGELTVDGFAARKEAVVTVQQIAEAGSAAGAVRRIEADEPLVEVVRDALRIEASASQPLRSDAVRVTGDSDVDVVARVAEGSVVVVGVTGDHAIEAERVEVVAGSGDRMLTATRDGMVVVGEPQPGDVWVLDATGDLRVTLPAETELELDVVLSEGANAEITGLPFDDRYATDDFVRGRTGSGAVDVRIEVRRGTLWLAGLAP